MPLGESGLDVGEGRTRIVGQFAAGRADAVLEPRRVEQSAIDGEQVPRPLATQQLRVAECPAQQRHVALQRVHCRRRWIARPDIVDQPVDGDARGLE